MQCNNRRQFLRAASGAAILSKSVLGANDRVNVAPIGVGARFNLLDAAYMQQDDVNIAALCDVNQERIDEYRQKKLGGRSIDSYNDYRRVLERNDIDAVVICTPDHWHAPIMIAALEAGKDVYVEKPATNTIDAAVAMLKAYRSHNQVVQLGTQQRSWTHFRDAAKLIWDGYIGEVTHVVVAHSAGGGGRRAPAAPPGSVPVPDGLDWDAFLGPAKKVPYDPERLRSWRSYWDYGGGAITDWGVHWMDIVGLCMRSDTEGPSYTCSVSVPNEDPERVSNDWMISYTCDRYLMTFLGFVPPSEEPVASGPAFYGTRGWLRVNRNGYIVRANRSERRLAFTAAGQAAARGGGAPAGGRGGDAVEQLAIDDITQVDPEQNVPGERGSEVVHVRNFVDCIKSREKPTAEFEIGFHSTLPCLLGRRSVKEQQAVSWDERNLTARIGGFA